MSVDVTEINCLMSCNTEISEYPFNLTREKAIDTNIAVNFR